MSLKAHYLGPPHALWIDCILPILTILAAVLLGSSDGQPLAGPYVINVEQVEPCSPNLLDYPFPMTINVKRYRHDPVQKYYGGNCTTSLPIDDDANVLVTLASWSSRGGWKENALVMKFPGLCTSARTFNPDLWKHFVTNLQGPNGRVTGCPIPPGSYSIENLTTSMRTVKIRSLFYGRWRLVSRGFRNGKCFLCITGIGRIDPKVPSGSQG